jgi:hypothetical protein
MGRRPGSQHAAIHANRSAHPCCCETLACRAAALVLLALIVQPCLGATIDNASTSRDDRMEARRQIPLERLTPEARQRIGVVVDKPSLFRRMPTSVIDCDPHVYRFLVRYPEVVVNIWQLMGITKVSADRVGPYSLNAKDGVGTVTNIELVYGDQDTHLMYCEGHYDGPLFRRPLTGRCVLLLKSEYGKSQQQRWEVTSRMDVFLQIDNIAVDAVTRTLHPLLGKSADLNFVQSTEFLARISRTSEENGSGMARLARRLDNVQPDVREQFALLTQAVHESAQGSRTESVAQNVTPERTRSVSGK